MDTVWDILTGALLLGWFTTALFGAVAGAAVAVWARVHVLIGVLVGFVALFPGIAVLLIIGSVRAAARRREQFAQRGATPRTGALAATATATATAPPALAGGPGFGLPAGSPASPAWSFAPQTAPVHGTAAGTPGGGFGAAAPPAWPAATGSSSGAGSSSGSGWPGSTGSTAGWPATAGSAGDPFGRPPQAGAVWPTSTTGDLLPAGASLPVPAHPVRPASVRARAFDVMASRVRRPSWPAMVVAVLAVVVAGAYVATTQLTWVSVRGPDGRQIFSAGPFELQLGTFVAASAAVATLSGIGVLLWRSAWWPVLCAWCATWWIFVAVEVLTVSDGVTSVNRFVQSAVSSHTGYEEQAALLFGDAWTWVLVASIALLVTSVALLGLQYRATPRRTA